MKIFLFLVVFIAACAVNTNVTSPRLDEHLIGVKADAALHLLTDYSVDQDAYSEVSNCYYLQPKNRKAGPHVMIVDEVVARLEFVDKDLSLLTDKGIGVGSSKQDILIAYSNASVQSHPYLGQAGEYIKVELPSGNGLVFETEFDVVAQYRLGKYPEVEYIEGCL